MSKNNSSFIPWFLFILLLGVIFYCCWLIWNQYSALTTETLKNEEQIKSLYSQKQILENILKQNPCEAKKSYLQLNGITVVPENVDLKKEKAAKPISSINPDKASQPIPNNQNKTHHALVAKSPSEIEAACVFIVSIQPPDQISTGSGFFVTPKHILTNRHVISKGQNQILLTGKGLGKPAIGRVVAQNTGNNGDYALIEIISKDAAIPKPLNLASQVEKTETVGAWGFPNLVGKNDPKYARLIEEGDLSAVPELSYSAGVVSAVLNRDPKIIVHTAPISPGNSGGPLVNQKGEVVGINTMITIDEDSYRQASIAIASSELKSFLQKAGLLLD